MNFWKPGGRTNFKALDEFAVWENGYDKFFKKRSEAISEELKKRIILQQIENIDNDAKDEVASTEDMIDERII